MPDWNDLRYLLALKRAGTLQGAARDLKVDHTTVSRRIAALEEALGAKLVTRTPEGLVFTPPGEAALSTAEAMETQWLAFERQMSGDDNRCAGNVRVTASISFTPFLTRAFASLRERWPEITVEIISTNALVDLARREADLAVRLAKVTQGELISKKLFDAGWSMYASESYLARKGAPPTPTDLTGHDLVGFEAELANVPGAEWLAKYAAGAQVAMKGNSIHAVIGCIAAGLGISVVPCFLATEHPQLKRLTPEILASREVYMVIHPDLRNVARVRAVMDHLAEFLQSNAELLTGRSG